MRFAKIQFADRGAAAQAMAGLARRGGVTVLREHVFIVPEAALEWLNTERLPYRLLERLNQYHVVQTLRNCLAHTA